MQTVYRVNGQVHKYSKKSRSHLDVLGAKRVTRS
jgi:hypothetical protein